jgi:iron-sulfur cluster repair protein YtfE (RIC family)
MQVGREPEGPGREAPRYGDDAPRGSEAPRDREARGSADRPGGGYGPLRQVPAASADREAGAERVPRELGERVQSGFQDLSRLLGAIKETLQSRDGQVQQTLQALPTFLQQVPRIHRAEIECLAQISKQLEHMGGGTRDVLARLDGLPDLLRTLTVGQAEQSQFLDTLQSRLAETLETQSQALRQGLEQSRKSADAQLQMIRGLASTQEDIFATFQNTQNRALNVFHRAQQQSHAQHRETQSVMNRQIELLVDRVHSAQSKVFWLSIGFAALAAGALIAVFLLK